MMLPDRPASRIHPWNASTQPCTDRRIALFVAIASPLHRGMPASSSPAVTNPASFPKYESISSTDRPAES